MLLCKFWADPVGDKTHSDFITTNLVSTGAEEQVQ